MYSLNKNSDKLNTFSAPIILDHIIRSIPETPHSFYKFGRAEQKGISPSGGRKVFSIKKVLWLNKLIVWTKLSTVKNIVSRYRRYNELRFC